MIYYKDLKNIPTKECGEALLSIDEHLPEVITCYQTRDMYEFTGNTMLIREGCMQRLRQADRLLKERFPEANFLVVYGYRHPKVQQKYFNAVCQKYADLNKNELLETVHKFIAVPDVAGHPTGGAIDVTLQINGEILNMGTDIADFEAVEKLPTFSKLISKEQRENRILLRSVLLKVGFAPYDGEWWHFSYGDKEWAHFYAQSDAIYDQISISL